MDFSWMLDRTVITLAAGAAFVLWGATGYLRCLDARNRRRLVAVAAILALWMLVVVIRWKVSDELLKAILWYAYYIPLTILPLLCLLCATRVSGLDRRPWANVAGRALWCFAVALAVLVLTNDIHEQVFRFLGGVRSDGGPYAYAWGHGLVMAWSLGCYLAFFAILFGFSRRRLKPVVIPVVTACLVGLVFSLAYGMQMPWASRLNFSLVYGVLVAGALEFCLDFGLIASSRSFTPLFDSLPFDLKVLDRSGALFRETRMARPLDDDVREQLVDMVGGIGRYVGSGAEGYGKPGPHGAPLVFTLASHPGKAFHAWHLSGGIALLTQDTRELDALTRALALRQEGLRRTNQMLEQRSRTEGLLAELSAEQALMDDVERAISRSMGEIARLLDDLPVSSDVEDAAARQLNLRKARMILGYCKRKSSLVLFEAADPELDRERIGLIVNELAGDLRAVGIDCAAMVGVSRSVSAHDMSVLYDCIYDVAFTAFTCTDPVLMYYLGEREDATVELRAQLQSEDEDDLAHRGESGSLHDLLARRDVVYSIAGGPGFLRLVARTRTGEAGAS